MTWVENNPYKMGLIASVIVSLGAALIHYKTNNLIFDIASFFSWLPVVWAMVFVAPVSESIINGVKKIGVLQ